MCLGLSCSLVLRGSLAHAQPAPNSDQLQQQITVLEKQPAQATAIKSQLDAARNALVRARDTRAAGDVEHGIELEALAADQVATARSVLRAIALEAALIAAQSKQIELETALRQTETLLEATIAQRERTRALLQQAQEARAAKKAVAPKAEAAKAAAKKTDAGKSAAPKTDAGKSAAPKTDAGKANVPKTETGKAKQGGAK
jgi:hypothetical protein